MKSLLPLLLGVLSHSAFAKEITVKVDLSRHIEAMSSVSAELVYVSTSSKLGCETYSGDIFEPARKIHISKNIKLNSQGVALTTADTEIDRCDAKLSSIKLKIRMDRKQVARANNASRSEVDKNRIDFDFGVFEPRPGQFFKNPELSISKLYVAGSDALKYTFAVNYEAAAIINDQIDLSL